MDEPNELGDQVWQGRLMQQLKPVSSTMTEKLTVYKHRFFQCRCVDSTSCWQVQDEGETGGHLKPHFSF